MNQIYIAIIFGVVCMIGWGVTDIFNKNVIDKIGSYKTSVYINGLATIMSFPILLIDWSFPKLTFLNIIYLLIFSFLDFLGFYFLYKAYQLGKVSILNPITSSYAILTSFLSYIFFAENFPPLKIAAVFVTIIGILLTSVNINDLKDGLQTKDLVKGVPQAIIVFCIYGTILPFWDRYLDQEGWIWISILARFLTFIFTLIFATVIKKQSIQIPSKGLMKPLFWGALFISIGNWGFNLGLKYTNQTSIIAVLASAYPLVLLICAYIFLKERIATNQYFGIFLIVAGIVITSYI
ncbi:EamA family transporter [Candidatus Dojkabacteria bacterium]|nr:EamA family transporter [Candidatus Dojkabacteria bacterium]